VGATTVIILVVEDEADFIEELRQIFLDLSMEAVVVVAQSRASAFDLMQRQFFDLMVLDLKIPTIDGALDADPEYGHAVFTKAQTIIPGTPIFVLTGSPAEDFIQPMLGKQQQVDIWGQGEKVGNLSFLPKFKIDQCPRLLEPIVSAINSLADVELNYRDCELTIGDDRLVRIFAKRAGGAYCDVTVLDGGLTDAKVARLHVTDSAGAIVHDAIAKLGSGALIQREGDRFDRFVARLDPSATPRKLATLEFGAGTRAGNFYSLARGFDKSAFQVAISGDGLGATCIQSVETATRNWLDGVAQSRRTIREVRQRILSDDLAKKLASTFDLKWAADFETREIQTRWACIHGDLHGSNILVSSSGNAVLIDYADVGDGPASLDPVTLELSLIFHPQGPLKGLWPATDHAQVWGTIDAYAAGCPAAPFIHECRDWAVRVAAGKREIAASAYAFLIRQLKYGDTNKELILALLEGVRA
jgi:CheY-like chemotaxis protein